MSARHKARKRTIDLLYEAEIRKSDAVALLESRPASELVEESYVATLVKGVSGHQRKIDELISLYAEGWELDRLPALDRNILRLGIYEMLWETDLDDRIAIDEAVSLAEELSTAESSAYVNGVLGRIGLLKSTISLD